MQTLGFPRYAYYEEGYCCIEKVNFAVDIFYSILKAPLAND